MNHQQTKKTIPKDQLVMGLHTIKEILVHAPERVLRVYTEMLKDKGRKSEILDLCNLKKIPISYTSFHALTDMVGSDSHQSFVAQVKNREFVGLKEFLQANEEKEKSIVLMLDQIFDPQNLGALLRSAECFGVDAVVFSKNRGSEITPVTTKTSCGASELVPLIRVSNLAEALTQFQDAGFDAVTTLLDPNSQSLFNFKFSDKTLLIMGSEGEGIQPLICKRANRSIYIPMQGHVESLNVAQACAVLLYAAKACLKQI
jgi:23S rRNA (guanosine2251-2'-O)-methyltransferase